MDTSARDPEPDLGGVERRLARLTPSAVAIDRDRLLFEAGRAAGAGSRRRGTTAMVGAMALVAIGLGGLLARERGHRRDLELALEARDRPVLAARPAPPLVAIEPGARELAPDSYLALTRNLLVPGPAPASAEVPRWPTGDAPAAAPPPLPLRVRGPGGLIDL